MRAVRVTRGSSTSWGVALVFVVVACGNASSRTIDTSDGPDAAAPSRDATQPSGAGGESGSSGLAATAPGDGSPGREMTGGEAGAAAAPIGMGGAGEGGSGTSGEGGAGNGVSGDGGSVVVGPAGGGSATAGVEPVDGGTGTPAEQCTDTNFDVPAATVSGTITPPNALVYFRNDGVNMHVPPNDDGSFSIQLVAGNYELVRYDPVAGYVVVDDDIELAPGQALSRDVVVPDLVLVSVGVLMAGDAPRDPFKILVENDLGSLDAQVIQGVAEFAASPGDYDLLYSASSSGSPLPGNSRARLGTLSVGADGANLTVEIPSVSLSGTLAVAGMPDATDAAAVDPMGTVYLVGPDGDSVTLGQAPSDEYSANVVLGAYDVYFEDQKIQSNVLLQGNAPVVLDITVPTGVVSGATQTGQFEGVSNDYFYLQRQSSGAQFRLSNEGDAYSEVLPVGTYDLIYSGPRVNGVDPEAALGWPRTGSTVLQKDVVVSASQTTVLDLEVSSAVLQGNITLAGANFAEANAASSYSYGWLFLRAQTSDQEIEVATDDGTYTLPLIPGSYDLYYQSKSNPAQDAPSNEIAKLESGIVVSASGTTHDIDIPISTVSGSFTIGGKERADLDGYGQLFLQTEDGRLALNVDSEGRFSETLIAGTYDVYYQYLLTGTDVPQNTIARIGEVALPSGPFQLDIDVPVTLVSGDLTLGGQSAEPLSPDGRISVQDEFGETEIGLLSSGHYEVALVPGSYDVYYSNPQANLLAPLNAKAKIGCLVVP